MLRPRIIPCLLIHNGGLVKTVSFKTPKYVGDPLNAVKIFNEKEVDELIVLDIDASINQRAPDFKAIKNIAMECRMPFCYGGGIKTREQAKKIIQLGAEKVAISSAAFDNPSLLSEIGEHIGVQSVVVVIDVKKKKNLFGGHKYEIYTHNGTRLVKQDIIEVLHNFDTIGVGEIVINSIDNDGKMNGYDLELIELVRNNISTPLTALGGAGKIDDFATLIQKYSVIGASAGSFFVFKGVHRAVLINYLDKKALYKLSGI